MPTCTGRTGPLQQSANSGFLQLWLVRATLIFVYCTVTIVDYYRRDEPTVHTSYVPLCVRAEIGQILSSIGSKLFIMYRGH